jgi:hypothetical protein
MVGLIPTDEKIRFINSLLFGWVRDTDLDAVETMMKAADAGELPAIRSAVRSLVDCLHFSSKGTAFARLSARAVTTGVRLGLAIWALLNDRCRVRPDAGEEEAAMRRHYGKPM